MKRDITKNGITIIWDTEKINDVFFTTNAVYALEFPNGQIYIGSCENLADRLFNHCTHRNSKKKMTLNQILNKYKVFNVHVLKTCSTINDAKKYEKKIIKEYSKNVYKKLDYDDLNFKAIVNKVLLNSMLYTNQAILLLNFIFFIDISTYFWNFSKPM